MADTIDKRVSDLEEMVGDIPRLINIRFAHIRAQLDAADARMGTVEAKLDRLAGETKDRFAALEARMGAVEAKLDRLANETKERFAALEARMGAVEAKLDRSANENKERFAALEAKVDALPRALAELLTRMLDERGKS